MSCHASFSIEHVHGHHRNVATRDDPATARRGESIYAFIARSIVTQSISAWRIEKNRLIKRGYAAWNWRNRMPRGIAMSLTYFASFYWAAGWRGVAFFALASGTGRIVLEFSNYMQHYGLVRQPGTPVRAHHSWNSTTRSNSAFLFNLTRHTSHHQVLNLRYWECRALPESWMLPFGYLFGGCLMMIPPLWHRAMAPLLKQWEDQHASPREKLLAAEANALSGSRNFSWPMPAAIEQQ
jgi:alkane 1-monooxygenase